MSLMSGEHVILCRGAERAIWHSSPERFCKFYKFRTDKSGFSSPSAHGGLGEEVRQEQAWEESGSHARVSRWLPGLLEGKDT